MRFQASFILKKMQNKHFDTFSFLQNKPAGAHGVGGLYGPPGLGSKDFILDLDLILKMNQVESTGIT